jgi:hypothetical protein
MTSDMVDARMPIFGILSPVAKPANARSTMKLVSRPSSLA